MCNIIQSIHVCFLLVCMWQYLSMYHIMVLKWSFYYLSLSLSRIVYLMFLHYTIVSRTVYIFQNYLYSQKKCIQLTWEVVCKRTMKRLNVLLDIYNYCINFEEDNHISYCFSEINAFQNHHSQWTRILPSPNVCATLQAEPLLIETVDEWLHGETILIHTPFLIWM